MRTTMGSKARPLLLAGLLLLPFTAAGCVGERVQGPAPQSPPEPPASGTPGAQRQARTPARGGPPAQSASTARMEAEVVRRINAIRAEHKLGTLRVNPLLARVARGHSRHMASRDYFSHTSPSGGTLVDRARAAGLRYRTVAENIFMSTNVREPVSLAVEGWMKSRGHRENILRRDVTETGVGIWRRGRTYYVTQNFLRPRR